MISYSARAAKALGFLKQRYNDVEIFDEDASGHAMWLRLLRKLLPGNVRLESVNVLGGRGNVIEACRLDQINDGRKKLYIVDGDFDYVTNKSLPRLRHLYRLKAYSIENLILHPLCIFQVCRDYDPTVNSANALQRIEYDRLIGQHELLVKALYVVYATAQEFGLGIETVKYSVYKVLTKKGKSHELDVGKVWSRIRAIVRVSVRSVEVVKCSRKRRELWARGKVLELDRVVSGKNCILPILWLHMRSHHNDQGNQEEFKLQLAKEFTKGCEPFLARRLRAMV